MPLNCARLSREGEGGAGKLGQAGRVHVPGWWGWGVTDKHLERERLSYIVPLGVVHSDGMAAGLCSGNGTMDARLQLCAVCFGAPQHSPLRAQHQHIVLFGCNVWMMCS